MITRKLAFGLCAAVMATLFTGATQAVSVIDTTPSWNGTDYIFSFGETDTATYGQTFTVTAPETVLESFTFYLDDILDSIDPDVVDFEAYVYAWDGNSATGSALFSSGPYATTNNGGAGGFEQITINTGGLSLTAGSQYVAFFNTSNLFDGENGGSHWGATGGADTYSGGAFVFLNNGSNFGALTTDNWTTDWLGTGSDLAFTMTFSDQAPIPEPATMTLIGLGLAGLVVRSRRKA
jgi:hypothetical protein